MPAKRRAEKSAKAEPTTNEVDAYLATVPEDMRTALEKLRRTIKAAAPAATERIGYGIPMLYQQGRPLVGFAAAKNHCGFYCTSPALMESMRKELESYDTSKGTIRFPPNKPLPAALIKKIVKARIAENERR
jgi:uncharacterized protein YdhG (YjbR/CyaY superfamily)